MKNYYLLVILTVFSCYTYAQTATKLSIQGEAKKKVLPDISIIDITIVAKEKTEQDSYKKLIERSNDVLKKLHLLDFNDLQIKLNDFSIEPEYKRANGISVKIGFKASQNYSLRFPLDKLRILRVYTALTEEKSDISLSFSTEVSDSLVEKIQNDLIGAAIDNAKFKANIIAEKINTSISGILNIAYKYEGIEEPEKIEITKFTAPKFVKDEDLKEEDVNKLFSINETEFSETINFIFLLGKKDK